MLTGARLGKLRGQKNIKSDKTSSEIRWSQLRFWESYVRENGKSMNA